jgi:nucleoid-associated protein YgaU
MFFRGSRYQDVADAIHVERSGREIPYKRLRWIPLPPTQDTHTVAFGERLDHIAHRHYGDPEQFWRIADANLALHPAELTEPVGRVLRISLL